MKKPKSLDHGHRFPAGYSAISGLTQSASEWLYRGRPESITAGTITSIVFRPRSSTAAMTHKAVKVFLEQGAPTHI
ncbi:hypothetical protein [Paraburkholderia metrosideri]|uniref:Uncharacterized protein n=1 Tax=Paraburkholderia metrosideri TaxID=580937 RepID=A0ABN7HJA0_9BURK|nr:hypothetical protein [Paraburkholderia metrosideri]CAD6522759.1 hypothetical protein LMG28140_01422 [Paraburkholderia metrosideri]